MVEPLCLTDPAQWTRAQLRSRLLQARAVLSPAFRRRFTFGKFAFDEIERRLVSDDGKLSLSWVDDGRTTIGSVYLADA